MSISELDRKALVAKHYGRWVGVLDDTISVRNSKSVWLLKAWE